MVSAELKVGAAILKTMFFVKYEFK